MPSECSEFTVAFPGTCVTHSFRQGSVNICLNKCLHVRTGYCVCGYRLGEGSETLLRVLSPVFLVTGNSSQDSSGSPNPVFYLAFCPFQVVFLWIWLVQQLDRACLLQKPLVSLSYLSLALVIVSWNVLTPSFLFLKHCFFISVSFFPFRLSVWGFFSVWRSVSFYFSKRNLTLFEQEIVS